LLRILSLIFFMHGQVRQQFTLLVQSR